MEYKALRHISRQEFRVPAFGQKSNRGSNVKLSHLERLMLANQFAILSRLYPDEAEYYDNCRVILASGFEKEYAGILQRFAESEVSEEICDEVLEILDMFDILRRSYDSLEKSEKERVEEQGIDFPGFDGNNEIEHLCYAQWFCGDEEGRSVPGREKRFELLHPIRNSHGPTIEMYRRMLAVYRDVKPNLHERRPAALTPHEVNEVLAARIHPDSR